jgi:hypothetical protein
LLASDIGPHVPENKAIVSIDVRRWSADRDRGRLIWIKTPARKAAGSLATASHSQVKARP